MNGFTTRAVHGPKLRKDPLGALRPPLYESVAFEFDSAEDIEDAFTGKKPGHTYSRITNPTVEELEQRIRLLTYANGVIAVSSGMAAIADTVMSLAEPGSNIVTSEHLFSHTLSLFTSTLGPWGLHTRFADMTNPFSVKEKIDENTRLIFLETITNPQLEVADVAAIVEVAKEFNIPVVVDGTMTTPYLFSSKQAGAAVEIISSTKFLSGGATTVGGLIIDNGTFDWSNAPTLIDFTKKFGSNAFLARLRKEVYRNLGSCLSPHNAWLQILGIETLALRVSKCCQNALTLAQFLASREEVVHVNYPGLSSSPSHITASRQLSHGFGGILTFDLGSKEAAYRCINNLRLIRRATNLNDNKTLIIHPASTIFHEFSPERRERMGITEGLIRLSVGIEESDDLLHDISQGLETP